MGKNQSTISIGKIKDREEIFQYVTGISCVYLRKYCRPSWQKGLSKLNSNEILGHLYPILALSDETVVHVMNDMCASPR